LSSLVSVVVPAHNAEKWVSESIGAIADQDYDPMEILFVDDGSTDATVAMALEKLKSGRHKFEIIQLRENMGVSMARNEGLRASSGEYVIFADADDRADPDFVSTLRETVAKHDSDLAFCGYRYKFDNTEKAGTVRVDLDPSICRSGEEIAMMYVWKRISPAIWTTIFKKSFLDSTGIQFTAGCGCGEDVEFLTKAFALCGKIASTKLCPYLYAIHPDRPTPVSGASDENPASRRADGAEALIRTAQYLKDHSPSRKVRDIADSLLLPEGLVKRLNAAARQNDAAKFYRTLNAPETRRALMSSRKHLARRPEVFAKAALMMIAPHIYFKRQSRP
jgi:hypothetical protein